MRVAQLACMFSTFCQRASDMCITAATLLMASRPIPLGGGRPVLRLEAPRIKNPGATIASHALRNVICFAARTCRLRWLHSACLFAPSVWRTCVFDMCVRVEIPSGTNERVRHSSYVDRAARNRATPSPRLAIAHHVYTSEREHLLGNCMIWNSLLFVLRSLNVS